MSTNAALWLSIAVAGILVVATLDKENPEITETEDSPETEPKKVIL